MDTTTRTRATYADVIERVFTEPETAERPLTEVHVEYRTRFSGEVDICVRRREFTHRLGNTNQPKLWLNRGKSIYRATPLGDRLVISNYGPGGRRGFITRRMWDIMHNDVPYLPAWMAEVGDTKTSLPLWPSGLHVFDSAFAAAFIGTNDMTVVVRRLFPRAYRKDLVRAFATAPIDAQYMMWQLRSLVPTDWIIAFPRNYLGEGEWRARIETIKNEGYDHLPPVPSHWNVVQDCFRPVLRQLDRRSLRRLTMRPATLNDYRSLQSLRYNKRSDYSGITSVDSWSDLHLAMARADRIAQTRDVLAKRSDLVHGITYQSERFDGTRGRYRFKVASCIEDFLEWGNELDQCVVDHVDSLLWNNQHIVALYRDERVIANIEVQGNYAVQVLGYRNHELDDEAYRVTGEWLAERGITIPESAWGYRNEIEAA